MKTAIITGASGGIGLALTEKFVRSGYFVIAQYNKNPESLLTLKERLGGEYADMLFPVQADLSAADGVNELSVKIGKSFSHIDVLVNNAGVDLYKLITDTTDEELLSLLNVNLVSAYKLSRNVLSSMIERKSGKIVNISSVWGKVGASMETAYSVSKAGLIGLTKSLAKEVAPSGITVNCVCPGVIDTPMNANFSAAEMEDIISDIPSGRLGDPEEIADLVLFLCSDKADYITGQVITADGGYTL